MTLSDEESEEREEPFSEVMVLVSFATTEDPPAGSASNVASILGANAESNDDEEILDEEMVHSYRVMYEKLVEDLNENQDLRRKVSVTPQIFGGHFFFFFFIQEFHGLLFYIPKIYETILFKYIFTKSCSRSQPDLLLTHGLEGAPSSCVPERGDPTTG